MMRRLRAVEAEKEDMKKQMDELRWVNTFHTVFIFRSQFILTARALVAPGGGADNRPEVDADDEADEGGDIMPQLPFKNVKAIEKFFSRASQETVSKRQCTG